MKTISISRDISDKYSVFTALDNLVENATGTSCFAINQSAAYIITYYYVLQFHRQHSSDILVFKNDMYHYKDIPIKTILKGAPVNTYFDMVEDLTITLLENESEIMDVFL